MFHQNRIDRKKSRSYLIGIAGSKLLSSPPPPQKKKRICLFHKPEIRPGIQDVGNSKPARLHFVYFDWKVSRKRNKNQCQFWIFFLINRRNWRDCLGFVKEDGMTVANDLANVNYRHSGIGRGCCRRSLL